MATLDQRRDRDGMPVQRRIMTFTARGEPARSRLLRRTLKTSPARRCYRGWWGFLWMLALAACLGCGSNPAAPAPCPPPSQTLTAHLTWDTREGPVRPGCASTFDVSVETDGAGGGSANAQMCVLGSSSPPACDANQFELGCSGGAIVTVFAWQPAGGRPACVNEVQTNGGNCVYVTTDANCY